MQSNQKVFCFLLLTCSALIQPAFAAETSCENLSVLSAGRWIPYFKTKSGSVIYFPTTLKPKNSSNFWYFNRQLPNAGLEQGALLELNDLVSPTEHSGDITAIAANEKIDSSKIQDLGKDLSNARLSFQYSSVNTESQSASAVGGWVVKFPVTEAQILGQLIKNEGHIWGQRAVVSLKHECGMSQADLTSQLETQLKGKNIYVTEVPFSLSFMKNEFLTSLDAFKKLESGEESILSKDDACGLVETALVYDTVESPMTTEFFSKIGYYGLTTHGGNLCLSFNYQTFLNIVANADFPYVFLKAYSEEYQKHFHTMPPNYFELWDYRAKVNQEKRRTRVEATYERKWENDQWADLNKFPSVQIEGIEKP